MAYLFYRYYCYSELDVLENKDYLRQCCFRAKGFHVRMGILAMLLEVIVKTTISEVKH